MLRWHTKVAPVEHDSDCRNPFESMPSAAPGRRWWPLAWVASQPCTINVLHRAPRRPGGSMNFLCPGCLSRTGEIWILCCQQTVQTPTKARPWATIILVIADVYGGQSSTAGALLSGYPRHFNSSSQTLQRGYYYLHPANGKEGPLT